VVHTLDALRTSGSEVSGWEQLLGFFFFFISLQSFFESMDTAAKLTGDFADPTNAKQQHDDYQDDD
jgi:hypothetical protein